MTQVKAQLKFLLAGLLWLALFLAGMLSIYAAAHGLPYRNLFFSLLADVVFYLH